MKKTILIPCIISLLSLSVTAQENTAKQAQLNEDGNLSVTQINMPHTLAQAFNRSNSRQSNFTFGRPANPQIKNSRGVTLADIDNDGVEEILYGIDTTLYALEGDGTILWSKTVLGPILLPPTVADLDDDGTVEIIVNTGYPTTVGRIYVTDNLGTDLPSWPQNFSDNWFINAPAVSDVDGDGALDIISCRRAGSAEGYVHVFNLDGSPLNANWPVQVNATPAFTPSIGDIDNDGDMDVVIATSSTGMYAFDANGDLLTGFPLADPNVKYSYQSPILVDLDGDETLEIVGSNHGDAAAFYVMNHDATYAPGWPIPLGGWTYSPSTVADFDNDGVYDIFMADRNTSGTNDPLPTVYGLAPDGTDLTNFPIEKYGGNEGVLTIADITNDNIPEIIFGSVLTDMDDNGYIHAYSMDGSGEVAGFPLRPRGFTFLNGAVIGDVDGDGMMDLTANSYTLTFGTGIDSTFVNTYNLNVPYNQDKIYSNGYKGSNHRDGLITPEEPLGVQDLNTVDQTLRVYPNPSEGIFTLSLGATMNEATLNIYTIDGKILFSEKSTWIENEARPYDLKGIAAGIYFISVSDGKETHIARWIKQ